MKKLLITTILALSIFLGVSAQTFNGTTLTNIVYGSNINYFGVNETLKLDVYIPPVTYTNQKFPLLVYIHGGGFLVGTKAAGITFCKTVSSNGFVSASIDYRLGRDTGTSINLACDDDYASMNSAVYRAMQDAKASLRFLVNNANAYSIDTNWIFICGQSAGGITSLSVKYLTQDSANFYLPGVETNLGSLDNATNALTNTYSIKGIGNFWGAIASPYLITPENAVPTIFTHGRLDPVVPFDTGYSHSCSNFPIVYGSLSLYNRTKSFGVPAVMHEDSIGVHGVFDDTLNANNLACFFNGLITNHPQNGYYVGHLSNCDTVGISINIEDISKYEKNTSQSNMIFTLTLNKPSTKKITVKFASQNGSALAGSDYVAKSGTITFNPGITQRTFAISIYGDRIYEPDEIFSVNLSNSVNAIISKTVAIGTILNDD